MDKVWNESPSKLEVIGGCGRDEKRMTSQYQQSLSQRNNQKTTTYIFDWHGEYIQFFLKDGYEHGFTFKLSLYTIWDDFHKKEKRDN